MESLVKTCIVCGEEKLMDDFHRHSKMKDGHVSMCKSCFNIYQNHRINKNSSFKINHQLLNQLNHFMKRDSPSKKLFKTMNCSRDQFRKWIDFLFDEEMTFDNYGKIWNYDHLRPTSSFNLTNDSECKVAWSWRNICPCLIEENTRKGTQIDQDLIDQYTNLANIFESVFEYDEED